MNNRQAAKFERFMRTEALKKIDQLQGYVSDLKNGFHPSDESHPFGPLNLTPVEVRYIELAANWKPAIGTIAEALNLLGPTLVKELMRRNPH